MEIHKPVWRLKRACPCCKQGSSLAFSTCPACGHILLVCEEVGSVFRDSRDLSSPIGAVDDAAVVCPSCRGVAVSEFRDSMADEVQQLGFQEDEYE
jgi:hypothetical protein